MTPKKITGEIGVGLVGLGYWGPNLARNFSRQPNGRLLAICDKDASCLENLHECGIPTRRGVMASHLEAPYSNYVTSLANTELAFDQNILLPMHPSLSEEQQMHIVSSIGKILADDSIGGQLDED